MGFFTKIINAIKKASIPSFIFENNQLVFHVRHNKTIVYDLGTYDLKTRHDPYVFEAYTLHNSDIYLEYIKLDSNATWNGFSRGFYESMMKENLKLKSLEVLKRQEHKNFEFSTYKVDESFILHLIFIWGAQQDIFLIDTKGKLFTTLMKAVDKTYEYPYASEEKGSVNFDISLVKNNAFKSYFNQSN